MKTLMTFITVLLVLAAIGAACYGAYLGLIYLWEVYAALEATLRIVLLSGMSVVLVAAIIVANAIRASANTALKRQLTKSKLRLYSALVEAYKPCFAGMEKPSQQALARIFESHDALQAELQVLSAGSVLQCHDRLRRQLRDREPRAQLDESFQKLVKSMRRDIGHGAQYDESKLKFLINLEPAASPERPGHGVNP